ncbi:MAG: 6-pyruvoyl-tetrahydropterin synthase-related protein [Tolumonas sp.]|nr:6-pyruvoyl-tetrahydropterin synthase-related protein [Tolumonas sp.]
MSKILALISQWRHLVIIVAAGLLLTMPLLVNGCMNGHDFFFHVIFSHHFTEQFWNGDLYPRWMSKMNAGFGSPTFFFYAPLPYYITSFISLFFHIDNSSCDALVVSASLALIMSGVTAFFWLNKFTSNQFALIIAVIYMVLPYHFVVDIYIRFAFAELWSFVWMPLILYWSLKVSERSTKSIIWLSVSISLLIFTHLPTFIIFMPVFVGHFLFVTDKGLRRVVFLKHLMAIMLAVGLSAIYWVPAMTTQDNVSMQSMFSGMFHYTNNFLLSGPIYGHSTTFWRYLTFITVLMSTLAYGAWLFSRMQTHLIIRRETNYWIVVVFLSLFMTLPFSQFIWDLLPALQKIQFPWRFNTILTIAAITVFALAVSQFDEIKFRMHGRNPLIIWFLLLSVLLSSELIYGVNAIFFNRVEEKEIMKSLMISRSPVEYRPYWVPEENFRYDNISKLGHETPQLQSDNTDVSWQIKGWQPRSIRLLINASVESKITVHQFYYPGWAATLDDKTQLSVSPSNRGLLQLSVPAGKHEILLTLDTLIEERIGQIISTIVLLIYFLLGVKNYIYARFLHR